LTPETAGAGAVMRRIFELAPSVALIPPQRRKSL
jgi:hypothetical protein